MTTNENKILKKMVEDTIKKSKSALDSINNELEVIDKHNRYKRRARK